MRTWRQSEHTLLSRNLQKKVDQDCNNKSIPLIKNHQKNILKFQYESHLILLLSNLANLLSNGFPYIFPEDLITVLDDKTVE